ncbi:hypothetical protein EMIHUDRAFT_458866 [Emiliania huxleyi CCMP1516]|uniref:PWWP domain-containing protein n=2 Tax=Emiliania huxleyi TaxID=2903 RepID=A0A0D3J5E2_EMIH1|nr:hypothetical protein EMIHUDRAFT_458866 [Emiliania huxleyi CCMP1516]EOD18727.1 hypothetical protein EMIHUDRAFT_458866 [Emiliania huxleyi CCMP1516]|eukprot:XP_005771156.1 hypothetical protein EMIHUDRAFT_458866 [Emiliania huxleyi CCMP1516]
MLVREFSFPATCCPRELMGPSVLVGNVVLVKLRGYGQWPAIVCHTSQGGPLVQASRGANTVLLRCFGDHKYVWGTPAMLTQFDPSPTALSRVKGQQLRRAYQEAASQLHVPKRSGPGEPPGPPSKQARRDGPSAGANSSGAAGELDRTEHPAESNRSSSPLHVTAALDGDSGGEGEQGPLPDVQELAGHAADLGSAMVDGTPAADDRVTEEERHREHLLFVRKIAAKLLSAIDNMLEHHNQKILNRR